MRNRAVAPLNVGKASIIATRKSHAREVASYLTYLNGGGFVDSDK